MDPYIVTLEGARLRLTEGVPTHLDVAVNHCRTPMFCGHTRRPYSVAHHCLSAAELAQEARFAGTGPGAVAYFTLLHEVEVAVWGDVPGPVKTQDQRNVELAFRLRYFDAIGTPLPKDIWSAVEFYDKVEQAASATWLGLAETVHDRVWASTPEDLKTRAIDVTRKNYEKFPPRDQLEDDAPLARRFLYQLSVYRAGLVPTN